jgi:HEAT repeat protein
MRRLAALALLALAAHATSPGRTTLSKFINGMELICVGKVVRVIDVPAGKVGGTVRVAEVDVVEWFRGAKRPKRIWYLAEGRVDADDSDAVKGERALLFLAEPEWPLWAEGDVDRRLKSPAFRNQVNRLTGGAPMLLLSFLGNGRMPLEQIEGVEYANIATWLIRLPPDATTIQGPDPRLADLDRRVRFDYVRRLIKRCLTPLEPPPGEAAATVFKFLEALETDTVKAEALAEELDEGATVPILLKLLDDPAFPRRDTVTEALIWAGGHEPDLLLEELASKNVVRRRAAAFALDAGVKLELVGPDDPVIEAVRSASADPDPEVRAYATGMLMRMYELDRLLTALSDKSSRVRASARQSLLHYTDRTEDPNFPFAKAEAALLAHAADEDVDARREVWELLGFVAGPASRATTLEALTDADRVVRVGAVRALGRLGEAKRLIGFLASKDAWVRRVAAYALGEIGPPAAAAVPALEKLLEMTEDPDLAYEVKRALEKIRKRK